MARLVALLGLLSLTLLMVGRSGQVAGQAVDPGAPDYFLTKLAFYGDPTPIGSSFTQLRGRVRVINDGDVFFGASLLDGRSGIFKDSRGEITKIVATGDLDPIGTLFEKPTLLDANDAGEVLFFDYRYPLPNVHFLASSESIRRLDGNCFDMNDAGQLLCGGVTLDPYWGLVQSGLSVVTADSVETVVVDGDALPDVPRFVTVNPTSHPGIPPPGEITLGPIGSRSIADGRLNNLGQVVYSARPYPFEVDRLAAVVGNFTPRIYLWQGTTSLIAGSCSVGGGGHWGSTNSPVLNDLGEVMFSGYVVHDAALPTFVDGTQQLPAGGYWSTQSCPPSFETCGGWTPLYIACAGMVGTSARHGIFSSSGNLLDFPDCTPHAFPSDLNNRGQVLVEDTGSCSGKRGTYVLSGGVLRKVFEQGDPTPVGGTFGCQQSGGAPPFDDDMNDAAQVVFAGVVSNCRSGVFLASPVRVQLTDTCFLNDRKITFDQPVQQPDAPTGGYTDNGGDQCEWSQVDGGGTRNLPVAYIRGRNVNLQAKFSIEPPLNEPADAEVTGVGPDGIEFRWEGSVVGGTLDTGTMIAATNLPDTVGVYDQMTIQWFVEIDGAGISAEQSKHTLYRTLGPDPPPAEENYLTLLDIGSRFAAGMTDSDAVAAGVWNGFRTQRPAFQAGCGPATGLIRAVSPAGVGEDGRVTRPTSRLLRYYGCYNPATDPLQQDLQPCVLSVLAALRSRIGNCYSWAQMLNAALVIQDLGERATVIKVMPALTDDDGFLVNNWDFVDPLIPIGRHPYVIGDTARDMPGVPGQGNPNPPGQFSAHWIVCYQANFSGPVYFDPSYGFSTGPATYENTAIAGFYSNQRNLVGELTARHARKQDPQVQELDFLYWSGTLNPNCESTAPREPELEPLREVRHMEVDESELIEVPVGIPPVLVPPLPPLIPINLTVSVSWPGSDVETSLISPSARVISRSTSSPDVIHDRGSTFEVYDVADAERGEWTVRLFGADVPPSGEGVTLTVTVLPRGSLDSQPPSTTAGVDPEPNAAGWNNTDVSVGLAATDEGSGVKEVHYRVDAGAEMVVPGDTAPVLVTNEGLHIISYWAVDNTGNVEDPRSLEVRLDKAPPALSTGLTSGTYFVSSLVPLTVPCSSSDPVSGLAGPAIVALNQASESCPVTISQPGTYTISMSATDLAGNQAAANATYTVHKATVLAPLFDGVLNTFRLGRTLPVKIGITDGNGAAVTALSPTLWLLPGDWTPEAETTAVAVADSGNSGDSGNTMRYSSTCLCYIFNLSTGAGFTVGQRYTLVVMAEGHVVATLLLQGN